MKCPKCSSNNPVLAKVCDACGYSPLVPGSEDAEAIKLAERINLNLAALKAAEPMGSLGSMAIGFLTLPTLGLAWIAQKAWQVFANPRRSAGEVLLRLGEDVRTAETSFGSDPSFRSLINQAKREMDGQVSATRLSMKQRLIGVAAFVLIAIIMGSGVLINSARKAAAEQAKLAAIAAEIERVAVAIESKLNQGLIEDAVAAFKQLSESDLASAVSRHPSLSLVQIVANGEYEAALAKTALVTDGKSRSVVESVLAELALKSLGSDYDQVRANSIAGRIGNDSARAKALDSVIAAEARKMIDSNRYQDAKALIATLSSSTLRDELEARINARQ